ncbi:DEAD/DEAH box helicase [Thermorudis peleae]|uniref:DEAD/DEAH box helicase n=1 Tax=Thermorudis peleae TaxID=1382356 RepID=UPI000A50812B|nr:DEAD/DEAH box helicase [Thermorudis peleae]
MEAHREHMHDTINTQEILEQFAVFYPFQFDPFQVEAIEAFLQGDSVMVAAPTGTGKTVVAEFGVYESFRRGSRVMYTTPIKALSNQKFRDLRAIYGNNVGLLTGDVTENPDAMILVMTTEVLRNMMLQTPWELDNVECIIFDEIHYLADPERGTTWEEAIILCPEHIQLICLSATVSNAQEIADWISRTHRPIRLIVHNERAVPLALYYYYDKKLRLVIDHHGHQVADYSHLGGEIRRQIARGGLTLELRREAEEAEPPPWEIVQALAAEDMLPAIYFLFSRRDCEDYAQRLAMMRVRLVRDDATREQIEQTISHFLTRLRPEDQELTQVQTILDLARQGIGFHHAGLLPILKQLVEVLFSQGLMKVVFATDTLALGVNMPARTVVIGRMTKWDGRRRRLLTPNEFQQMAGRAGRRGMDERGNVVVPYSPWISFKDMLAVATGELEPVRSAFTVRYNTVLNLWDPPHGDRVRHLLLESLAQYQAAQRVRQLEDDIVAVGQQIEAVPRGCLLGLDGDELLYEYRNLVASVNALRSRERRLTQERKALELELDERPWTEPGRPLLRRALKTLAPGTPLHTRDYGWTIFLGRGSGSGIALVLTRNHAVAELTEYRQIDYLPSGIEPLPVPEPLQQLGQAYADVRELVPEAELQQLWEMLQQRNLPDLDDALAAHRAALEARYAHQRRRIEEQLHETRSELTTLMRARHQHPCHQCPRRKEHQGYLMTIASLERHRAELERQLSQELANEERRVRELIRGIRKVLEHFDYLHRGYPTAKADTLAEVFDTNGLIICEMIDRDFFRNLDAADTAEVLSWFAFDRDARFANSFVLPSRLVLLRRRLEGLEQEIFELERRNGLFLSTGHSAGFYGAMRAWCHGQTMAQILEQIELSEGDLVMTFNKTLDLMRQVREMLARVMPEHPLRTTLEEAEALVRRDIVEQSLLIGLLPMTEQSNEAN